MENFGMDPITNRAWRHEKKSDAVPSHNNPLSGLRGFGQGTADNASSPKTAYKYRRIKTRERIPSQLRISLPMYLQSSTGDVHGPTSYLS